MVEGRARIENDSKFLNNLADFVASMGENLNAASIAAENNVIFVHGFLSSSNFWVDTVLPVLPESLRSSHRLFAVDVLGFGKSPKPSSSMYTIADHIEMIRKSVLEAYGIQSFHLVAHSMGCTISLALAAHYSSSVKSVTLIAPVSPL
jgi:pimeloyl-ACP methyl ester carboxylesterase